MLDFANYTVRPTTDAEKAANMPYITSSMMEAVNTCPRWGLVNSVHNKRFVLSFRQMALEAGSLMHEVFSIINLWQLGINQKMGAHADVHGKALFPHGRWKAIIGDDRERLHTPDPKLALEKLALATIATSEFYDDPNDRNRTVSNLEFVAYTLIEYWLMNMQSYPIYVEDINDPTKQVGIEFSLDVVFEIPDTDTGEVMQYRFIGLSDVLYQNKDTTLVTLGEFKTTSSMNDAWLRAFETRHQLSGYHGALKAHFPDTLREDIILLGSAVPVTKTKTNVQHFPVSRDDEHVMQFLNTVAFTSNLIYQYTDQPLATPMFTHSCNRYFRPCGLLDLCTAAKEDQPHIFNQMEVAPQLSPSEMKALLRRD